MEATEKQTKKTMNVQVFSEAEARVFLSSACDLRSYTMTLRELTCKEDFGQEQVINGQTVRTLLFHRYHKYYMWVAVPAEKGYCPEFWMVRATLAAPEKLTAPMVAKVPRRVFGNPLEAPIAGKIRPSRKTFVQVENFRGSKLLIPEAYLKVSVTAKKMSALLGITPHQVLPRIFGTPDGWFAGLLLREKHGAFYSEYIVDCFTQKVYNRAGFEYLRGKQPQVAGAGNVHHRVTHEIPLAARQKAMFWGGMKIRYNAGKDIIDIRMIE